jgi:large conductance mechanosensitive channel
MREFGDTLNEFKKFLIRGNVIDLAVAVMIGAAFTTVVNSLVKDLIKPLVESIGGQPDFSRLTFTIPGSKFMYGDFLNAVISFAIMAAVVFFLIVKPVTHLAKLAVREEKKEEKRDPQLLVLEEIRDALKKK